MSVEQLRTDITGLRGELSETRRDLAEIKPGLASLEAAFQAERDRRGDEVGVLFGARETHAHRISAIETTYWSKADQQRFDDRLEEWKKAREIELKALRADVAKIVTTVVTLGTVVQLAAQFWR